MDNQTPAVKKELTEDQIVERQVTKRSDHQTGRRLRRLAGKSQHNIDAVWAIVLSAVFDNTKPRGRMEPFLR